jgi:hypothetical protein
MFLTITTPLSLKNIETFWCDEDGSHLPRAIRDHNLLHVSGRKRVQDRVDFSGKLPCGSEFFVADLHWASMIICV